MTDDLAFVHTSPVHVATFAGLVAELAPQLKVRHVVAETLLEQARASGVTAALQGAVQEAMLEAASSGATTVVCTCSTIGGMAEAGARAGRFRAMRIDRAMADRAVTAGRRILVVAALQSTLQPTRELIEDSARHAGAKVEIAEHVVPGAWAHFERGDQGRYLQAVADAIRLRAEDADVIVLAQASMAPAAERVPEVRMPVLSSPRLGVAAAIKAVSATMSGMAASSTQGHGGPSCTIPCWGKSYNGPSGSPS